MTNNGEDEQEVRTTSAETAATVTGTVATVTGTVATVTGTVATVTGTAATVTRATSRGATRVTGTQGPATQQGAAMGTDATRTIPRRPENVGTLKRAWEELLSYRDQNATEPTPKG